MRKLSYFFFLLVVLTACQSKTTPEAQLEDNFTISGTISQADQATLYLEAFSQKGTIEVAKTSIQDAINILHTEYLLPFRFDIW